MRYLKSRNNGDTYEWNEILAANPACYEITEEEMYPERFVKPIQEKRKPGRPSNKIALATDFSEDPSAVPDSVVAEASTMGNIPK